MQELVVLFINRYSFGIDKHFLQSQISFLKERWIIVNVDAKKTLKKFFILDALTENILSMLGRTWL